MHIVDLSRNLASALALESQLFDVTGRWTHVIDDATQVVYFGDRCARHGAHMELLSERLPVVNTPGFDTTPTGANPHETAITALRSAIPGSDESLECYHAMLSTLVDIYRGWHAAVDPLLDGPTAQLATDLADDCTAMLARTDA